jgi:23S rRNA (cytosine1962-C5)-methyltransferase
VTEQDFWTGIRLAARDAKRQVRLLEQRGQASDHPILATMPETRYLKYFLLQIL